jgi:hypothetical protein
MLKQAVHGITTSLETVKMLKENLWKPVYKYPCKHGGTFFLTLIQLYFLVNKTA